MKNLVIGLVVIALVIGGVFALQGIINSDNDFKASGFLSFNAFGDLKQTSTSTGSFGAGTSPIKLLDQDNDRLYAIITNPSDTAMYLTITTTDLSVNGTDTDSGDAERAATTTITALDGIYLAASGGTYEILPENLAYGNVYVTSSAGIVKKQINVSFK